MWVPPPLVLHVIHHLVAGGMENGLTNLIRYMPRDRFRHAIVCIEDFSDFRDRLDGTGTEIIAAHRSRIGTLNLRYQLYAICRRLRPAILHSRNTSGLDALPSARLAGVPRCIHSEHGFDVDNLGGRRLKAMLLRRAHAPFVDQFVAVSKDLERYLVTRVGVAHSRVTQIYNGVDTVVFAPGRGDRSATFPAGFADENSLVVGTVGRVQPIKDQATLVNAFARVLSGEPSLRARARLVVVGDGPLLANLRATAHELGIAASVWFPGLRSDIRALLQSFDLFVLPSLSEGVSNTVLEAMATGLPVVATAAGGNTELVRDGETGRLFNPGDADTLANLLGNYLLDETLLKAHGAAGRARAVAHFSLDSMVARYLELYERFAPPPFPRH